MAAFVCLLKKIVLGQQYGQLDALPYSESGQIIMQPADPDFEEILTEAEKKLKTAHMKSEQCGFMNPKLEQQRLDAETQVKTADFWNSVTRMDGNCDRFRRPEKHNVQRLWHYFPTSRYV